MMDRLRRYEIADECKLKARLHELDCEWDTERAFEGGAAGLVLLGSFLGAVHSRKWFLFSAAAGMLMLERALRGWCPLQPVLRRLGVRTASEIAAEKDAIRDILAQRAEEVKAEAQPEEGE
jgi:hypothetical protein